MTVHTLRVAVEQPGQQVFACTLAAVTAALWATPVRLTLRNRDIINTRDKLGIYSKAGLLSMGADTALPQRGKSDGT